MHFTILFYCNFTFFYNVNYAMTWAMMDEGAIPEKYSVQLQVLFQTIGFLPEIFCSLLAGSTDRWSSGCNRIQTVFWIPDRNARFRCCFCMHLDEIFEKKKSKRKLINNMNQKPYIIEKVYVETPVDTDGDGKKDLIAVYLRLPKEVEEGKKVPAIYVANPYMLTCNEDWYVPYNVDCEVKAFPAQDIKEE